MVIATVEVVRRSRRARETGARRSARDIRAAHDAIFRRPCRRRRIGGGVDAAHELVRERYRWRGYDVDGGDIHAAAVADARRRREITFLAANREGALGTLTLRLDGPRGLRAEGTHGHLVQSVRVAGKRVCELTRLAVADSVTSKTVLAALFSLAFAAADALHGVTDVFIEVNPRHVAFYLRILGFVAVTGETFLRARPGAVGAARTWK